jgi:hypothetical protein
MNFRERMVTGPLSAMVSAVMVVVVVVCAKGRVSWCVGMMVSAGSEEE